MPGNSNYPEDYSLRYRDQLIQPSRSEQYAASLLKFDSKGQSFWSRGVQIILRAIDQHLQRYREFAGIGTVILTDECNERGRRWKCLTRLLLDEKHRAYVKKVKANRANLDSDLQLCSIYYSKIVILQS